MESRNPNYKSYTEHKIGLNRFMKHLGFKITDIQAGRIEGHLDFESIHEQQDGWVHGGVTSALCDMVCGYAAYSMVPQDDRVVTVEIKISYFKPGRGKRVRAIGKVVKPGSKFHFCEAEIYSLEGDKEILMAKASSTMAVIPASASQPSV